jgi:mRNA interferase RelE/StbE
MPDPYQPKQFTLVITRSFYKDLQRINKPDQIRIRKSLSDIESDPYKGRKVVSAEIGQYRWRVGNYRIRYDISGQQVIILRVIKREDVYRRF